MDDLGFLLARIPAYADYADEDARHLVDKQVRAYVGEAISLLRERASELSDAVAEMLERTLMMCEFTDQQLMHVLDHLRVSDAEVELLHEVDHELVAAADRAAELDHATLEEYLSEIHALFARRVRAVSAPV